MEHILSLSYGKDSLACLGAIEELGLPLDRIIHAEVWATDTIPADLPPMVEFKKKADKIIAERWGIEVEHTRADISAEDVFYRFRKRGKRAGQIIGFPMIGGCDLQRPLKIIPIQKVLENAIQYIGIAYDEPNRFNNLDKAHFSPLVEAKYTEQKCRIWCEENELLSPVYTTSTRSGCWFCPNQPISSLRKLRYNHPELWELLLKWDNDSPVSFRADGHTVHDLEKRFSLEDAELIPMDRKFRWEWLENPPGTQMRLF